MKTMRRAIFLAIAVLSLGAWVWPSSRAGTQPFIVQASSSQAAAAAVAQAGGAVGQPLAVINAVSAELSPAAASALRRQPGIALYADAAIQPAASTMTADSNETSTKGFRLHPAAAVGTTLIHQQSIATPRLRCKEVAPNSWQVIDEGGTDSRRLQGRGVTVAIVDTGFMKMDSAGKWKYNATNGELFAEHDGGRCIVYRDFLPRTAANDNSGAAAKNSTDQNGHGTHVAATIADNRLVQMTSSQNGQPIGVAPQVNLVIARALDKDGAGTYSSVISAIDWILQNKDRYRIRVINLSIYAPVSGPYWSDPLNQAVMRAWKAGLVVVTVAGNSGTAASITAPGNVPYVITVGAIKSGRYSTSTYDELAAYSSRGPTESAFVKPDLVVPASRTIAPMPTDSTLAATLGNLRTSDSDRCEVNGALVNSSEALTRDTAAFCYNEKKQVDFKIGTPAKEHAYYQLSGTSMGAAEVSGLVALLLQKNPYLSNDQIKYALMATARPAIDTATGAPVYSPWEQGAGIVDIERALQLNAFEVANESLDIATDLDTTSDTQTHYWGMTTWDSATNTYNLSWAGGSQSWAGGSQSWAGGSQSWAGGSQSWAGGSQSWAGGSQSWAGGSQSWAGSVSFWAGGSQSWAGSVPSTSLGTASHSDLLIDN